MVIRDYRVGHVIDELRKMPAESVQSVVTSPPYWGLRKYSGDQDTIWGGDKDCEHEWGKDLKATKGKGDKPPHRDGCTCGSCTARLVQFPTTSGNFCQKCGAWKGSYGLEPTPELYVRHTVEILREIRRVLRNNGTVFWNLGDSYCSAQGGRQSNVGEMPKKTLERSAKPKQRENVDVTSWSNRDMTHKIIPISGVGLKPKDLILMPFRVALAVQEDGWWVRSVIVWNKPNPMPESVTDRPTTAHEYILLLTKSSKYYWDADGVKEKGTIPAGTLAAKGSEERRKVEGVNARPAEYKVYSGNRNIRSVWTIPTQPYPKAHFATFPEKLPELCIRAGTSEKGNCPDCGNPWVRVVEKDYTNPKERNQESQDEGWEDKGKSSKKGSINSGDYPTGLVSTTVGWKPTCSCRKDPVPAVVLDPFAGSGTTIRVAGNLGRSAIGIDIADEYREIAEDRAYLNVDCLEEWY